MTEQLPLRGASVYNPGLLNDDELKTYFVARRPFLDYLVEELRREIPDRMPQHRLIVGTRGMGKTLLLRRLALSVKEDHALASKWLPLTFPEEQYNISRLSDLWINCLDALSDTLEQAGEPGLCKELDDAIDNLPEAEEERASQALEQLLAFAERLGKRLILLVDNIDIVFERLKESHWEIRELLGHEPRLLLIGASSRMLEVTYEYDAAFYDFFKLHELKGLSEEEMNQVLARLAEADNNSRIISLITDEPARLRTLHTLTGGNPRTTVLLYGVLAQGVDGDVRSDLERLLDLCTPLYKARFEELSAQSQKVVDAMAIFWDPLTAGELAKRVRLPVNSVSTQLTRLEQQGIVEKVSLKPGRKSGFQVAERFFNIWYLMRTSRRVRRRLIWLVQFLKVFYSQKELQSHAKRYLKKGETRAEDKPLQYADLDYRHTFSTLLTCNGNWPEAVQQARVFIEQGDDNYLERTWDNIVLFFREAVTAGYAKEAAQLLQESNMVERWRPLHVALTAIAEGNEQLTRVAPEVRHPAEELIKLLNRNISQP